MLKRALLGLAACTAAIAPAHAAVTVSSVSGSSPWNAPATFNFDSATPEWSGSIFTDSLGSNRAQPLGSTGGYAAVGITPGGGINPGDLDLSGFASITEISFLWGSVDDYNTIQFLDANDQVLASFTGGSNGIAPADGNQTDANSNRIVTFAIDGATSDDLAKLRFTSGQNAFEFDNLNVQAVPEPATWAMMIAGFGLVGGALRRRSTNVTLARA